MNERKTMEERRTSGRPETSDQAIRPAADLMDYFQRYGREKPEALALWCFGIGFVLGWRLKPW